MDVWEAADSIFSISRVTYKRLDAAYAHSTLIMLLKRVELIKASLALSFSTSTAYQNNAFANLLLQFVIG